MVRYSVCRLCLASETRTLDISGGPLQEVYEKLTSIPLHKGFRPVVACYLCHYQLKKTHDLMVKSLKADNLLTELCLNALTLNQESITGINREANRLNDTRSRFTIVPFVIKDPELIRIEQKIKDEPVTEGTGSVYVKNEPSNEARHVKLEVDVVKNESLEVMEDTELEVSVDLEVGTEESQDIKSEIPMDFEDTELVPHRSPGYKDGEDFEDAVQGKKCEPIQDTTQTPQLLEVKITPEQCIFHKNKTIKESKKSDIYITQNITNDGFIKQVSESTSGYCTAYLNTNNMMEIFVCDLCGAAFRLKHILVQHIEHHSDNEKNINLKKEDKLFECTICHRKFRQKCTLNIHSRIHTGEKPFKCRICQRKFRHKLSFDNHLNTHSEIKPFKCKICQRGFNRKPYLENHLNIHTGEKPFKCDVCKREFNHRWILNNHIKTHTGERPFKCGICQRGFIQKSNLNHHMKVHTGEKPFKCSICEYTFSLKGALNRHLKTHNGEKETALDASLNQSYIQ